MAGLAAAWSLACGGGGGTGGSGSTGGGSGGAVAVTGVTLDRDALELIVDGTDRLVATVVPADASDPSVRWSSSDEAVVAVSAAGELTARSPGQAGVVATTVDGGFVAACTVRVRVAARWARSADAVPRMGSARALALHGDALYTAGHQYGTGTYDYGSGITATGASSDQNVVLVSYDTTGAARWAATLTAAGTRPSYYSGVAVDAAGAVYAAGELYGGEARGFGNAVTAQGPVTTYDPNMLLVKYSAGGVAQWARTATAGAAGWFQQVAADTSHGGVYAAGAVQGTGKTSFSSTVSAQPAGTCAACYSALLVKYGEDGTPAWARTIGGGASESRFEAVAVDADGNVYAAGYIRGSGAYTFGARAVQGTYDGGVNSVLVKYSAAGEALWARTVAFGSDSSQLYGLAVDGAGDVYAVGRIGGGSAFSFGGAAGVQGAYGTSFNALVVKYAGDGTPAWARSTTAAAGESELVGVAADPAGGVLATGQVTGSGAFTFTDTATVQGPSSASNALLLKYGADGAAEWGTTLVSGPATGTSSSSYFDAVCPGTAGRIYVSGFLDGEGAFGFGDGVTAQGLTIADSPLLLEYR